MFNKLSGLVPERIKGPIFASLQSASDAHFDAWRDRKKVVITLAGFYQNLGDLAITYAQHALITSVLPDYKILYLSSMDTYKKMKALQTVVGPEDIITITGGGNMDDVYTSLEDARRYIVRSFPNNPIISFPQTMSFSHSVKGKRALNRSARTYSRHANLALFAREPQSYNSMLAAFGGVPAALTPDIVLSLVMDFPSVQRDGILICLRDDLESTLPEGSRKQILQCALAITSEIVKRDTTDIKLTECQPDTYISSVLAYLECLSQQRVVITDRLHAMLFCVLTRTPVLVLSNGNHKIRATYEYWLQTFPHVIYLDSFNIQHVSQALASLWAMDEKTLPSFDAGTAYGPLCAALLRAAGEGQ